MVNAIVALARERTRVDALLAEVIANGPRLTGSGPSITTEKWALEQFRSWGLSATREAWGELPVLFERGQTTGDLIRPARAALEAGTHAWTPGTRGQDGVGAGGPMRGQALLHPRDAAEFRAVEPYLRDAWIMVPHGFEYPDWRLMRQLERAFELAPISGYVHGSGPADDDRIWTAGDPRLDPNELPTRVDIYMRGDEHQVLLDRMAAGDYVELEFAVGNMLLPKPVPAHNVIAELEGELPEQRVVVGAHLDSWDGGVGAIDDGVGVATTMEAARLLAQACARAGVRPRRTISFQLWTGAEQGQLGSRAWVEAHGAELGEISAVLVHESGTNYAASLAVVPELHALMQEIVAPVQALDPERYPFALELVESLPRGPSDADSFLAAGVPAFVWGQAGRSRDDRYLGTQYDQAEAVIDEYQQRSAIVVALVAWGLASLPEPLPRDNIRALAPRALGLGLDEQLRVLELREGSLAADAGVLVGDRLLAVDEQGVRSVSELHEALQRGGPSKRVLVERGAGPRLEDGDSEAAGVAPRGDGAQIELSVDFRADPFEAEREARRSQRRARFAPELLPWDDQADGGLQHSSER